jgi:hypothetical protein
VSTGYLPASRSAIHESGTGAGIDVAITVVDQPLPLCGECPEAGEIAPGVAVIRYVSPVMRVVIPNVLCVACLPGRVAQLQAKRIEILNVGVTSPLRIEHLFNTEEA